MLVLHGRSVPSQAVGCAHRYICMCIWIVFRVRTAYEKRIAYMFDASVSIWYFNEWVLNKWCASYSFERSEVFFYSISRMRWICDAFCHDRFGFCYLFLVLHSASFEEHLIRNAIWPKCNLMQTTAVNVCCECMDDLFSLVDSPLSHNETFAVTFALSFTLSHVLWRFVDVAVSQKHVATNFYR